MPVLRVLVFSRIYQWALPIAAGQKIHVTCQVRSNNPGGTHNFYLTVAFKNALGADTITPWTVVISGYIPAWSFNLNLDVAAPAGTATVGIVFANDGGESASGYFDISKIVAQVRW